MIKTLQENKGRDFVIGDLHGMKDSLSRFLDFIKFDPRSDRVISVGDLVDRGPDSLGCLKLILEPWFHSVKANHEQLMEDWMTGGPTGTWWLPNGGNWFFNLEENDKLDVTQELLPLVQKLPWIITVEGPKKFHVIHAELSHNPGEQIFDTDLADPVRFKNLALRRTGDGETCIWGRNLFGAFFAEPDTPKLKRVALNLIGKEGWFFNEDLSHIFSGHTPVQQPTRILGQTNIDTFACRTGIKSWCGLTVVEPRTDRFWLVSDDIREVSPLILL